MRHFLTKPVGAALLAAAAALAQAHAAELHVMNSGGFTAAYQLLAPKFEAATGNTLDIAYGPSMGATPEAIRTGSRAASRPTS